MKDCYFVIGLILTVFTRVGLSKTSKLRFPVYQRTISPHYHGIQRVNESPKFIQKCLGMYFLSSGQDTQFSADGFF